MGLKVVYGAELTRAASELQSVENSDDEDESGNPAANSDKKKTLRKQGSRKSNGFSPRTKMMQSFAMKRGSSSASLGGNGTDENGYNGIFETWYLWWQYLNGSFWCSGSDHRGVGLEARGAKKVEIDILPW